MSAGGQILARHGHNMKKGFGKRKRKGKRSPGGFDEEKRKEGIEASKPPRRMRHRRETSGQPKKRWRGSDIGW